MFGNTNKPAADTTEAGFGEMLTMDALLGESVSDARLLEAKIYPSGFYSMTLSDHEEKTYEIKKEDHPLVGQQALQLNLQFTIQQIDDSGQTEYLLLNKKGKYDKVSPADVAKYVGDTITFSVFFGDDNLLGDDGKPKMRGRNQLRTILHKFVGPDNAAALGFDLDTASFGQLLEAAKRISTIVPIRNSKDYRDESRINADIDLLAEFFPQPIEA